MISYILLLLQLYISLFYCSCSLLIILLFFMSQKINNVRRTKNNTDTPGTSITSITKNQVFCNTSYLSLYFYPYLYWTTLASLSPHMDPCFSSYFYFHEENTKRRSGQKIMYTYKQQAYPKESKIPSDGIPTLYLNIFSSSDLNTTGSLFTTSDPCFSFSVRLANWYWHTNEPENPSTSQCARTRVRARRLHKPSANPRRPGYSVLEIIQLTS